VWNPCGISPSIPHLPRRHHRSRSFCRLFCESRAATRTSGPQSTNEAVNLILRISEGTLRAVKNLCVGSLIEAVRDQTKTVDLKQVNAVLMQPHWRHNVQDEPTQPLVLTNQKPNPTTKASGPSAPNKHS
jgi:hypothetical protein